MFLSLTFMCTALAQFKVTHSLAGRALHKSIRRRLRQWRAADAATRNPLLACRLFLFFFFFFFFLLCPPFYTSSLCHFVRSSRRIFVLLAEITRAAQLILRRCDRLSAPLSRRRLLLLLHHRLLSLFDAPDA